MSFTRAIRAFAAGSVVAGGIVLGLAGTVAADPGNGGPQGDNPQVTICHSTDSASNPWVQITVDESSVVQDPGNNYSVDAVWSGHGANASFTATVLGSVILANGCSIPVTPPPPPTPVAPNLTLTGDPSTACGVYTVPVVLTADAGSNLPDGTVGDVTFGSGVVPNTGTLLPSGTLDATATFPDSDAGTTQAVSAVVEWVGFEGNVTVTGFQAEIASGLGRVVATDPHNFATPIIRFLPLLWPLSPPLCLHRHWRPPEPPSGGRQPLGRVSWDLGACSCFCLASAAWRNTLSWGRSRVIDEIGPSFVVPGACYTECHGPTRASAEAEDGDIKRTRGSEGQAPNSKRDGREDQGRVG